MSESKILKPEIVRSYVVEILRKHGIPVHKAQITAEVLVEADMRGIFSHGINSLDLIVTNSIKQKGTDPDAQAEDETLNKDFPVKHINAHGDLGHPLAMESVDEVKRLARKRGYGKVYVYNANHFGIAAIYSEKICAEKDLAGRVTCTTPSVVKPYGGKENRLGTNLISWSIPYDQGFVTIDMATTIHAISGILRAFLEGLSLPFPVYDKNGKETMEPRAFESIVHFLEEGSMIPLGGIGKGGADVGYKGTGLAILIELDSVIGGGPSTYISPIVNDEKRRIRQTFEAWRIDTRFPKGLILQHISKTVSDMKSRQGKDMLLPGEKEARQREKSMRHGIPYAAGQIARLEQLGRKVGLGEVS